MPQQTKLHLSVMVILLVYDALVAIKMKMILRYRLVVIDHHHGLKKYLMNDTRDSIEMIAMIVMKEMIVMIELIVVTDNACKKWNYNYTG